MNIAFTPLETFGIAMIVLFVGRFFSSHINFLQKYNVPDPVVGGLIFSITAWFIYTKYNLGFTFDKGMKDIMMLGFFSTVGLNANAKLLKKGGVKVFSFFFVCVVFLILQNVLGVSLASVLGLDPLIGLFAGSITLSGGHGTGAIYAKELSQVPNAFEVAMACATLGLVLGGILGGPLAERLISKHQLEPDAQMKDYKAWLKKHGLNQPELVTAKTMLEMIFAVALCIIIANFLQPYLMEQYGLKNVPTFIYALFTGILMTNFFEFTNLYKVPQQTVDLIGVLSLSIFLTIALMSLELWQLLDLAGPLIIMIGMQTLLLACYAYFITFRLMGKNYEAAVMASGQVGFGLGATPTAVANMEAVIFRYGPAPQAFFIIPLVGAFFIDVANAGVIQMFLALLLD